MNDYEDEHIPSGCLSCGTENDETDYEELGDKWRIFCPYCDKTLGSGKLADEPIEEHGTMDKIEITHRFMIDLDLGHTNGVYADIVNRYRAGDTDSLTAITTTYNEKYTTTFTDSAMLEALQAYVDENERHLMAFMRAVADEESDPIGFHERAFWDGLKADKERQEKEKGISPKSDEEL